MIFARVVLLSVSSVDSLCICSALCCVLQLCALVSELTRVVLMSELGPAGLGFSVFVFFARLS